MTKRDRLLAEIEDIKIEKLRRRVAKARAELNTIPIVRPRAMHSDSCMLELDPDYYGRCTCGASSSPDGTPNDTRDDYDV